MVIRLRSKKKKIINNLKSFLLPVIVYFLFLIISKGRFGQASGMYAIVRQFVFPSLVAWALINSMILGIWDFTPGAVITLTGIIAGNLAMDTNTGVVGLVIFSIIIATILCLITFLVYNYLKIPSMITGLGVLMFYETLSAFVYGGNGVTLRGDITILAKAPWCFGVLIAAGIVIYVVTNYTKFGYDVRSLGNGTHIALNIGVNMTKTRFKVFLCEGIFLGLATVISLSQKGNSSATLYMGTMSISFDAIMGVFIGLYLAKYCNVVIGVLIGSFTMKMLSAGLIAIGLQSSLQTVAQGVFLLLFIGISTNQIRIQEYFASKKKAAQARSRQTT